MKKIMLVTLIAAVMAAGTAVYAIDENGAANEIENALKAKGLSTENKEKLMFSFKAMVKKGVPSDEALGLVKAAVQNNYSYAGIEAVANKVCNAVSEEGIAKEVAEMARETLQSRIKEKDMEKLMQAVKEAIGKDASAKQLRIMVRDLCQAECDGEGLVAAVRAAGDLVENGVSPLEARKAVSVAAAEAVKKGFKGEELANKVQDRIRERIRTQESVSEQLRTMDRTGMPEEVKDRIKTPDATKPADAGTGTGIGDGTGNKGKK